MPNSIYSYPAIYGEKTESSSFLQIVVFSEQGYTAKHVVITGGEPCEYNVISSHSYGYVKLGLGHGNVHGPK